MDKTLQVKLTNASLLLAWAGFLSVTIMFFASCGDGLKGSYVGKGVPFKELKFSSSGKVELTTVMGTTTEATYEVDGDKVKISAAGQTQIFTKDKNGCLDGGGMIGKFCKE